MWIGNDHSYECKTMVNYHEMVFEIVPPLQDGWPGTLKRLGVESLILKKMICKAAVFYV